MKNKDKQKQVKTATALADVLNKMATEIVNLKGKIEYLEKIMIYKSNTNYIN